MQSEYLSPVRSSLLIAVFFILACATPLAAQHFSCGTRPSDVYQPSGGGASSGTLLGGGIESHGGAHLPFQGYVRGLVVFVQTLNDSKEDASWPLGQLPTWNEDYVTRLERYYTDMSHGTMELDLDVHPGTMVTRNTEDGYVYWGLKYGDAIKEILDSLDVHMDFAIYDRWDSEANTYRLKEQPDGKVDLLIFVFRSISNSVFMPFSGVSDLGFAGHHFLDGSTERYVYGGSGHFNDAGSSGLSISFRPGHSAVMNPAYAFTSTIHELGHKLFGEGHTNELYGGLGTMANSGNGHAMSSFERHLAGYIHCRDLRPGTDTVITLTDYVSTGDAALLAIPQLDRAYFAFEFRGRKSEWDTAPIEGLYVYRIYDSWSKSQKRVQVISAEGAYEWAVDTATNTVHPIRSAPLTGYNRLQRIPIDGRNYWADGWWGVPSIAFREYRTEMAPWKNPSSSFMWGSDTIDSHVRMRLIALSDSTATVGISYGKPAILTADMPPVPAGTLGMPYPHPLSASAGGAHVPFSLARAGHVRLTLHDALGRTVATLTEGNRAEGAHRVFIPIRDLTAGTYHLLLETPAGRTARTVLIIR